MHCLEGRARFLGHIFLSLLFENSMAKFQEINFQFDFQFNLILSTIYILYIKRVSLAEELVAKGSQLDLLGEKGQHSEK